MITRQFTSFEVVNVRFTWIKWMFTVKIPIVLERLFKTPKPFGLDRERERLT